MAWLTLVGYPDANSERITSLRGPAPDKLQRYQERFAQGHYADLLLELEASLATAMFWFDGLHMAWQCLAALQAELAMSELEVDFAQLLKRLPRLPQLHFHDGTAFASRATRDWISLHVERHLRQPAPPKALVDATAQPWKPRCSRSCRSCARTGSRPPSANSTKGMQAATSERDTLPVAPRRGPLVCAGGQARAGENPARTARSGTATRRAGIAGNRRWPCRLRNCLHRCCDLLPQNQAVRECKEDSHRRLCRFDLEAVLE